MSGPHLASDTDLAALNAVSPAEASAALAPLFEGAPRFLARVVARRPFRSWPELFAAAREIAHAMPEPEQLELVDAHPRLGAPPGTVSAFSFREQGYDRPAVSATAAARAHGAAPVAGAAAGAPVDVATELERLNAEYEARFGFRYCVFVAGRPREALLPGLAAALDADRDSELHRALDAVIDIAEARHAATSAVRTG